MFEISIGQGRKTLARGVLGLVLGALLAGGVAWGLIEVGAVTPGTDDLAAETVAGIAPGAEPWFVAPWGAPADEDQGRLFALQAGIGGGLLGCYFGTRGRPASTRGHGSERS